MMSFCKQTLHIFLGFSYSQDPPRTESPCLCLNIPSSSGGFNLITEEYLQPANVLQSASVRPSNGGKKYSGVLGFLDDLSSHGGGAIDGLSSCTESLGFESSDQVEEEIDEVLKSRSRSRSRWRRTIERLKKREENEEVKKFPPLLSSLNQNGHPSFFLKPVRKDGRLEITEVKFNRPEILRTSRQDGRLRFQLIKPESESESESETESESEAESEFIANEDQESDRQWRFPVSSSGEGFRRCYDLHQYHHQIQMPLWNHQYVTTT